MFRFISDKKLKKIVGNAYDRGISRGYELGFHLGQAWDKGLIFAHDKPKVLKEAEDILRNKF